MSSGVLPKVRKGFHFFVSVIKIELNSTAKQKLALGFFNEGISGFIA